MDSTQVAWVNTAIEAVRECTVIKDNNGRWLIANIANKATLQLFQWQDVD